MIDLMKRLNVRAFHPAERLILLVASVALLISLVTVGLKGFDVLWTAYLGSAVIPLMLIGAGLYYRLSERSASIANTMIGAGIFIGFTVIMSMYNYLLLPLTTPVIDPTLAKIDGMLGYYWPDVMAWAAAHPDVSNLLKFAYITTIPQIAVLVVILGLSGRARELHRLLIAVVITAVIAICFWGVFPSLGAKSLYSLSPEIWNAVNPIVDLEYRNDLIHIAANGPGLIAPNEVRGVIAFPSYHAVLAFIAIWSARSIKWAFPVYLVLNLLILPACFIHGGHHFVDVPGGFVVFLIGIWCTGYVMRRIPDDKDGKTQSEEPVFSPVPAE